MCGVSSWLRCLLLSARSANRRRLERRHAHKGLTYADWIERHDTIAPPVMEALTRRLARLPARPTISVLMPVFNPNPAWLREAISSIERQLYPQWELCIADDASTDAEVRQVLKQAAARDPRIRVHHREANGHIARASNSALALASGEFVALVDHDDVVPAHALLLVAEAIAQRPRARLLYSDEDTLRFDGQRQAPNFKPDWNPQLMRAQNAVCHLGVYATDLVRQVGGFRPGFEGAQDYDLALRCIEQLDDDQIVHIPHVLYHWRQHPGSSAAGDDVKPYITEAGQRALSEHLARIGVPARVAPCPGGGYHAVPVLAEPLPAVSIVVRPIDDLVAMQRCLERLRGLGHLAAEVLLCAHAGLNSGTLAWLRTPESGRATAGDEALAFAAAQLRAATQARGEFLLLLDGDVELAGPDTLATMVALAMFPFTGAVGARLLHADGGLAHGGYIVGAGAGVASAHPTLGAGQHGYRSRAVLDQNMTAVSSACLLIRRSHFLALGGFDVRFSGALGDVDLGLRLLEQGLRSAWAAHAPATLAAARPAEQWPAAELTLLRQRWGRRLEEDAAYNPNLDLEQASFALAPEPRVSLLNPAFVGPSTPDQRSVAATAKAPASNAAVVDRDS
jgi:GT2 family glycosyltransferase